MTTTIKKSRTKAIEPNEIPEGYVWCNDETHIGPNPFPGIREQLFSSKRKQCKVCYNRYQKSRYKTIESLKNDISKIEDIKAEYNSNIDTKKFVNTISCNSFEPILGIKSDINSGNSEIKKIDEKINLKINELENKIILLEKNIEKILEILKIS